MDVYGAPDRYLRTLTVGTAWTYAYLLVDHLRWLCFEGLAIETVAFFDLERYVGAVGAEVAGQVGSSKAAQTALEATWQERALNAEETLKNPQAEVLAHEPRSPA